jgi:glutamate racemase
MTRRQLCARFAILTVGMISPALEEAISAKLQRISATAALFDLRLERHADQTRRRPDPTDCASQAITDLAEILEAQIIEDYLAAS